MNHPIPRIKVASYVCGCGCGETIRERFVVGVASPDGRVVACHREHRKKLLTKFRKQDELREFLRLHTGRGWLHRLLWARSLFRLVNYVHGSGGRQAVVSFLLPQWLANRLARGPR